MSILRYTLITDGSSDKTLTSILSWLLKQELSGSDEVEPQWADFRNLRNPPKSLLEKITLSLKLYPCDLLFVHRDAEKEPLENRVKEINHAVAEAGINSTPVVCVIPVRMLEAWLLFNETAIRQAAGNPNGKCKIQLPAMKQVENSSNPKSQLIKLLETASELKGRNLKKFNSRENIHRLATFITDFSPLRGCLRSLICYI
ncbi:MAG: hypothetical protein AAFQ80_01230 [Cyanobacteria bacterium J06621_8]